ncbi:MAG: hypothetical protein P8I80_09860 [Bacteroidales bacterium]|jgi:hypothetical protein|nr:hypothetical protein [Bacteroidales bacterium]MDG2080639.1 hypothetical protein [Bacteroidales bacterium]|tara:strand:- start:7034 stop:7720 length:687 start_codon:yes stop_codon:yes gene_type:complete
MKFISIFLFSIFSLQIAAQNNNIKEVLKEHDFEIQFLTTSLKDGNAEYHFDVQISTTTGNKLKVEKAKFDPSKPVGERWVLLTVNNDTPSKDDLNKFDKAHNTQKSGVNGKIDKSSWAIVTDDSDYLVLSYKFDKSTLPKKYVFLGDCKGLAYFNKKTRRLEKSEFLNEKPLKVKIFKVTKLNMVITYEYLSKDNTYLIKKEVIDMDGKFLGSKVIVKEVDEFSNYRK